MQLVADATLHSLSPCRTGQRYHGADKLLQSSIWVEVYSMTMMIPWRAISTMPLIELAPGVSSKSICISTAKTDCILPS